jgi:hypothetical protein
MAELKPWFHVVTSREGRPIGCSEFAVHLDHIRFPCNTHPRKSLPSAPGVAGAERPGFVRPTTGAFRPSHPGLGERASTSWDAYYTQLLREIAACNFSAMS